MLQLSKQAGRRVRLFILGMLVLPFAHAVPILDTYGPGQTANGLEYTVFNNAPGDGQSLAVRFALSQVSLVTEITAALFGTGQFELSVFNGDLQPGSRLHGTTLQSPTLGSSWKDLGWRLDPGSYWVVLQATPGASGSWLGGNRDDTAPWAATFDGADGEWNILPGVDTPALLIQASAIDEAPTWLLFSMAGALIVGLRGTRTRAGRPQR